VAEEHGRRYAVMKMMSKLTIARPSEEVFRLLLALEESAPDTHPGVKSVVKSPAGRTKAGTTVRFRETRLGWPRETTIRFILVEPSRKIEFEERRALTELRATITFEQTDDETTIVLRGETLPFGRFKSISPLLALQVERAWRRRLARIKAVLEASAP
jgi:hypothetical protein